MKDYKKELLEDLDSNNDFNKELVIQAKIHMNHTPNIKTLVYIISSFTSLLVISIISILLNASVVDETFKLIYGLLFIITLSISTILLILFFVLFIIRIIHLTKAKDILIRLKENIK